jgi:hypothetical protein
MSERYRLLFRGEVQEGQHPAVVKKRLGQALKLDGDRLETLFSGKAVILKRDADTSTAARYQALFRKSGARLRILPLEQRADALDQPLPSSTVDRSPGSLELLPPGSDVLRSGERGGVDPVEIDVSHLAVQGATSQLPEDPPAEQPTAPDVSHLSVAEVGAPLASPADAAAPMVDIDSLVFELAEVGATMDQRPRSAPPAAPDTSHLKVDPPDAD